MTVVCVTGANGHLGANLVRACLAEKFTVRAFVRPTADLRGLAGLDVKKWEGNVMDEASMVHAMEGARVLFHAAAVHRNWTRDPMDMIRPAVDGTRNAIRVAAKTGVRRVVYTSSIATVGYTPDPDKPLDETSKNARRSSTYIRAKCEAEDAAFEEAAKTGVELVVLCPSVILGPYDYRLTPAMRAMRDMFNGEPALLGVNPVHVADVAHAHVLAATKGKPGERYLVGGDNLKKEELAGLVAALTGRSKPKVGSIPRPILKLAARYFEWRARQTGVDPPITPGAVDDAGGCHLLFNTQKYRQAFGMTPKAPKEVLTDALRWLLFMGAVKKETVAPVIQRYPPDPSWKN